VTKPKYLALIALLAVAALALAGCDSGLGGADQAAEPTMTAIPLPTQTPTAEITRVAQSTDLPTPVTRQATEAPTATPTATASPEPTASPIPATPTPTATATTEPTATARPATPRPRPTATPEYSGRLIFQTTLGGDIYLIRADGSGLQRITDAVDPIWSPDGQQIAFARWREPRGIWVMDLAGGTASERRVFDWSEARWPSWSPDGQEILFSHQKGGQLEDKELCFWGFCFTIEAKPHWRLGIVQPIDGTYYEPPSPQISLAPTWSPTADQVVFDGEQGLVIQTLDGEVSYALTSDARDTGPVWSPDGKKVAFVRRQHDHLEVYVVDADGRNLTRLTTTPERPDGTPGNSAGPAWSPDGRHIAFYTDRTGKWEIWVMTANGGGQKPMFPSALDGLPLDYSSVADRAISWTE
jgi:dipeptidyl aminopeptidase/acylaminoacyl peptidase